ncbi:MAG: 50S ribosomal protein L3 [Pseudomonadales bacterium]|nr:50S ribosomal protein L3 [Candidatus Woesebacteria bacterium]MCB9801705.1 50S ribosomal protein L3 [Pseudomonadales bacterium]
MPGVTDFFATKIGMSQVWTTAGKRLAITRLKSQPAVVIGVQNAHTESVPTRIEVGYGAKKAKNTPKPLRARLEKLQYPTGVRHVAAISVGQDQDLPEMGTVISAVGHLQPGDVVWVQGTTKGKGFAGGIKRHGFHGGPKTHGQSDRARAVGSIGQQTPGRVFKGKKMPGHMGVTTHTVKNLVVLHVDSTTGEIWVSGPVPGSLTASVRLRKTGETKTIDLDKMASGIPEEKTQEVSTPEEQTTAVAEETA